MKYTFLLCLFALLFPGSLLAQQDCLEFHVSVRDAEQGNSLSGSTILDLESNEVIATDSNGLATFSQAYDAGSTTTLKVVTPGYPDAYREIFFPGPIPPNGCSGLLGFSISIDLASEMTYLSPPIGPSGGERVLFHPTGQLIYADGTLTGTPTEYLQRYKIVVPAGSLSTQFRIGLTPFLIASTNNAFFDTIASNEIRPLAQFRVSVYDLNGNPVASPTFDPPIRIEVAPATAEPWTQIESGMTIGFRHFDATGLAWDSSGIVGSGINLAKKSAFVDVSHFSVYGCFDIEPQSSPCFWTLVDVYPRACASPNGLIMDSHPVNCGVASSGTGPVVQDEEAYWEIDSSLDADLQAGMSNKLLGMGFTSKIHTETGEKVGFRKKVKTEKTIPEGSDPAYTDRELQDDGTVVETPMTGTVRIRQQMTTMLWEKYCSQQIVDSATFDFVTGLCLDVSELTPDASCP